MAFGTNFTIIFRAMMGVDEVAAKKLKEGTIAAIVRHALDEAKFSGSKDPRR